MARVKVTEDFLLYPWQSLSARGKLSVEVIGVLHYITFARLGKTS